MLGVSLLIWLLAVVAANTSSTGVLTTVSPSSGFASAANKTSVSPNLSWSFSGDSVFSVEAVTLFAAPSDMSNTPVAFQCPVSHGVVRVWVDDHLLCDVADPPSPDASTAAPLPPFLVLTPNQQYFIRLRFVHNATSSSPASTSLLWAKTTALGPDGGVAPPPPSSSFSALPPSALAPPPASHPQLARYNMQLQMATGWGTWWRPSALAATLLPEGATVTTSVCQVSSGVCLDPRATFTPEQDRGPEEVRSNATSRPGVHAWDRSYWQLFLSFRGLNVSLEWTGSNAGQGPAADQHLSLLATVVTGNASDFLLVCSGAFVFGRSGDVRPTSTDTVAFAAPGLRTIALTGLGAVTEPTTGFGLPNVTVSLSSGTAAASTNLTSVTAVTAAMAAARAGAAARLLSRPVAANVSSSLRAAATGMQAGVMWNVIYHPLEAAAFAEVSRSFAFRPYEIFEWDTFFGALLLQADPAGLAASLSSLIQVVKSKTLGPNLDGRGFVPGYNKGRRWLSEDRTERPVGAQMLLNVWQRWGTSGSRTGTAPVGFQNLQWLLDLLYGDLLDWQNWLWQERLGSPLNLAVLGSDPCAVPGSPDRSNKTTWWCRPSWGMAALQGARFESLDNSPMYDAPDDGYSLWNATSFRMRLYDVGQSAAMAAEAEALAAIARVLGRNDDANMLDARRSALETAIATHTWNDNLGVYSNVLTNGTQYPRIAPTSFYPMLSGMASDAQATRLVTDWLTRRSRFCVPAKASLWPYPDKNGTTGCYWGVPSISSDDPAYMQAGGTSGIYWRGFTWAPQVFLVYMGLLRYDHLPVVQSARQGLVAQQLDLFLSVWNAKHHVCENYPSRFQASSTNPECTGNQLYDWGGLLAYMGLLEQNAI